MDHVLCVRITIQHKIRLGHLVAATLANINKARGADTTIEWTIRSLFAKFRKGDMEIDHKPRACRPVLCDEDHLRQTVETQ
ncbi:hypothetical protein TNIN_316001 [Trichonephila inaurata madagascariensis]|uniref:Mos1 transposase HTH domain-containing protein n=1 Tax=Trichonephila inaurata madagascariensis TaxID=2747483 RepID=A0A8X6IPN3_9ARAC|nr:hypothetical protein TNIN_316001 [Trichonephila inaurata madagascariensis]